MTHPIKFLMVLFSVIIFAGCAATNKSTENEYYDSIVGKNPSLEEIYQTYQPMLESLLRAKTFCNADSRHDSDFCQELEAFYKDDNRMQLVNYVEDLADRTVTSEAVDANLDRLSELMQYRAMFFSLQKLRDRELGLPRIEIMRRIAKSMVTELEKSPLNSRRHQQYSNQAIPLFKRLSGEISTNQAIDESNKSTLQALNELER